MAAAVFEKIQDFKMEDFLSENEDYETLFSSFFEDFGTVDNPTAGNFVEEIEGNNCSLDQTSRSGIRNRFDDDQLLKYPSYIEMGTNAHDGEDMQAAFEKCCTEDVTTIIYYPKGNPHGYAFRQLNGLKLTADYLNMQFSSAPDCLFLVHSPKIVEKPEGGLMVTSKFTCNGTRLYVVKESTPAGSRPDPPALKRLHETMDKIEPELSTDNFSKIDQLRQPVTLKTSNSKYDRYKKQKSESVGSFVEYADYANFSESSLQRTYGSNTVGVNSNINSVGSAHKNKKEQKNTKNNSMTDIKPVVKEENTSTSSDKKTRTVSQTDDATDQSNNDDNNSNTTTNSNTTNSNTNSKRDTIASKILQKFKSDEVVIVDPNTQFTFSALLPVPISLETFGIMKFHLNAEGKCDVYEVMLASKNIKIAK